MNNPWSMILLLLILMIGTPLHLRAVSIGVGFEKSEDVQTSEFNINFSFKKDLIGQVIFEKSKLENQSESREGKYIEAGLSFLSHPLWDYGINLKYSTDFEDIKATGGTFLGGYTGQLFKDRPYRIGTSIGSTKFKSPIDSTTYNKTINSIDYYLTLEEEIVFRQSQLNLNLTQQIFDFMAIQLSVTHYDYNDTSQIKALLQRVIDQSIIESSNYYPLEGELGFPYEEFFVSGLFDIGQLFDLTLIWQKSNLLSMPDVLTYGSLISWNISSLFELSVQYKEQKSDAQIINTYGIGLQFHY